MLGKYGNGKTAMLRSVVGLSRARRTSSRLLGENVTRLRADQILRRGLVLVSIGRRDFGDLTVGQNLLLVVCVAWCHAGMGRWTMERVYEVTGYPSEPTDRKMLWLQHQLAPYILGCMGSKSDQMDTPYEVFPKLGEIIFRRAADLSGGEAQMLKLGWDGRQTPKSHCGTNYPKGSFWPACRKSRGSCARSSMKGRLC